MLTKIKRKLFKANHSASVIERFFSDSPEFEPGDGKVLQYVGISSMYLSPMEILMYHLLREQGFDVDYLVYDENVPINEVITKEREESQGKERFWNKSCAHGQAMLKAGKIPYKTIPISSLVQDEVDSLPDLNSVLGFQRDEIDFGNIVEGALFRYYKSLSFGSDAELVAKRMLVTALSNYHCVKYLCEANDYKYVLLSHGIYVTWQPVVEYCKKNGIEYICYDRAKTKDHGNFNVSQPSPDWSFDEAWSKYAERELTNSERQQVHKYLEEREHQQGDVYSYNSSNRSDSNEQKRQLGIPQHRKCVTLFTNLIWDAANVSRDIAFSSALDCVEKTIEKFRDQDDVQVIIRSHPGEKVIGTEERYDQLIRAKFGDNLPSNVTLITPEDNINSFTVIDMTDVGVVNTSTVGLEMAVLGKSVIVIADTHYRGKGFTLDATSSKDYFEMIDAALTSTETEVSKQRLAEKYFYMMMFLYQQKLPTRYEAGVFKGYSSDSFKDLSNSDALRQIIQKLADPKPQPKPQLMEWSKKAA